MHPDIVVFPELVISGYPPEDLLLKDHFIEDNLKILKEIASVVKNDVVILGFVDKDKDKKINNAAADIAAGKVRGVYHKKELPNYGVFDEKRYKKSGGTKDIFCLGKEHFAVNICEDIWADNGVYVDQAKSGAKIILN